MVRLDHPGLSPATDVAASIVTGGHVGNVDRAVAGEVLKEHGALKKSDGVFAEAAASRDFRAASLPLPSGGESVELPRRGRCRRRGARVVVTALAASRPHGGVRAAGMRLTRPAGRYRRRTARSAGTWAPA